jgi:outer membrane receptor protein involved in Fe transport
MTTRIVSFCVAVLAAFVWLPANAWAQGTARPVLVSGSVQDQTGAMLPGADVTLTRIGSEAAPLATRTGDAGTFVIENVGPGSYVLEARFEGFVAASVRLQVGTRSPGRQRLVLQIAGLSQEVTVGTDSGGVELEASRNRDGVSVDAGLLRDLPVFDRDVLGAVSALMDPAAAGSGGTTLVVDGMERSRAGVPASAIQEIRINQDPYSVEYQRPGHGRVEVITKAGAERFHGEANIVFRDASLNARNAFATTKPPEQRRIFEGVFGGPLGDGRAASFMLTANREETDGRAYIVAEGTGGPIRSSMKVPERALELSASINRQANARQSYSLRVDFESQHVENEGVGGTTLPEAATTSSERETGVIAGHRAILTSHFVHEFRLRFETSRQSASSLSSLPSIVVEDAFTGGGAQSDELEREQQVGLNDTLSWSKGRHTVKTGVAIPDWSWRRLDDRGNTGGTFAFASLADYLANRPFRYTLNRGDGSLRLNQSMVALFAQETYGVRRNLSLSAGVRYDWQSYYGDRNNVSPRASFAWSPGATGKTVLRGGAGVFYDRTGDGAMLEVERSAAGRLREYELLDPAYPNPLADGLTLDSQPTSIARLAQDLQIPYSAQAGMSVERQIARALTFTVNYTGARGFRLFRSLDVNAPPPPAYLVRPDAEHAVIRQFESTGRQWNHSVQFTLRGKAGRFFNGSVQYALSQAKNDTNGIMTFPANSYDLSGEWGRASYDQRHRFDMVGSLKPVPWFALGVNLSIRSGRPYSLTTGTDDYRNGTTNARPVGVRRNSLQGPGSARLDLRWNQEFPLRKHRKDGPSVTVGIEVFNALNRVNYSGYIGNMSSPFFGRATSAQPPRRIQLSLRGMF